MTPTQAAKHFHLLRSQTYKLLRKYKQHGTTALTPQSTRPTHTQPNPRHNPATHHRSPPHTQKTRPLRRRKIHTTTPTTSRTPTTT
ncbi:helix-turn-helix domain containing protein [Bifidobacterium pseudolongum]|nr:helix-turn-helix domain containing protein [Bifidobacterium pseudolongum]